MTYLSLQTKPDLRSRAEMIAYLRTHFRYNILNSWNGLTSYAHNIKIHKLNMTADERAACYAALNCSESFLDFNYELTDFNSEFVVHGNGRSDGYLVLCRRDNARSIDKGEDFADWSVKDIRDRCRQVLAFDECCERAVAAFVDFATTHVFVEKTIKVDKKIICAEESPGPPNPKGGYDESQTAGSGSS